MSLKPIIAPVVIEQIKACCTKALEKSVAVGYTLSSAKTFSTPLMKKKFSKEKFLNQIVSDAIVNQDFARYVKSHYNEIEAGLKDRSPLIWSACILAWFAVHSLTVNKKSSDILITKTEIPIKHEDVAQKEKKVPTENESIKEKNEEIIKKEQAQIKQDTYYTTEPEQTNKNEEMISIKESEQIPNKEEEEKEKEKRGIEEEKERLEKQKEEEIELKIEKEIKKLKEDETIEKEKEVKESIQLTQEIQNSSIIHKLETDLEAARKEIESKNKIIASLSTSLCQMAANSQTKKSEEDDKILEELNNKIQLLNGKLVEAELENKNLYSKLEEVTKENKQFLLKEKEEEERKKNNCAINSQQSFTILELQTRLENVENKYKKDLEMESQKVKEYEEQIKEIETKYIKQTDEITELKKKNHELTDEILKKDEKNLELIKELEAKQTVTSKTTSSQSANEQQLFTKDEVDKQVQRRIQAFMQFQQQKNNEPTPSSSTGIVESVQHIPSKPISIKQTTNIPIARKNIGRVPSKPTVYQSSKAASTTPSVPGSQVIAVPVPLKNLDKIEDVPEPVVVEKKEEDIKKEEEQKEEQEQPVSKIRKQGGYPMPGLSNSFYTKKTIDPNIENQEKTEETEKRVDEEKETTEEEPVAKPSFQRTGFAMPMGIMNNPIFLKRMQKQNQSNIENNNN